MIKTKIIRKNTKAVKEFTKKEWAVANLEHFGKDVDWKKEKYSILALDDNQDIVGYLGLEIMAGVAYVAELLVAKKMRGRGVGKKLSLEAEKISVKSGAHKIWLRTGKNWESVKFYKSLGYQITGDLKKHSFGQDFVIFAKLLHNKNKTNPTN